MDISASELAATASPGQFVMLAMNDSIDPFLRRPFGIAGIDRDGGAIRLIYQVVGRGTGDMSGWEPGRRIDLLGPLGNGFTWDERLRRAILVGGGMGIAPLLPLAEALRACDVEVDVFIGARSMDLLLGQDTFSKYGCQVHFATEDGSGGVTGFVTLPLEEHLRKHVSVAPMCTLFACGPTPLLKAVAGLCDTYKIEAQLSLEERMGCGFGACMGCSVQVMPAEGAAVNKRVCCEGPVFSAAECKCSL